MNWRYVEEKVFIGITGVAGIFVALLLVFIIGDIFLMGLPSLNIDFLIGSESQKASFFGAIGNAIVGTIFISVGSVIIATPFAIGTAVYLKEYAPNNLMTKTFRFLIDVLSGMPSIVLGIFGLMIIVIVLKPLTGGFSLISGSIALAILIMPLIEKAIEEAMNTVPIELEHGSYALGSSQWETISKIIIPYSMSGIVTGMVLGVGRAAEESAVVLLTAGYSQFFPEYAIKHNDKLLFGIKIYPFQDLVGVLPISIYHAFEFMGRVPISNAFATAFVLIVIVMLINAMARLILWRFKMGAPRSPLFSDLFRAENLKLVSLPFLQPRAAVILASDTCTPISPEIKQPAIPPASDVEVKNTGASPLCHSPKTYEDMHLEDMPEDTIKASNVQLYDDYR